MLSKVGARWIASPGASSCTFRSRLWCSASALTPTLKSDVSDARVDEACARLQPEPKPSSLGGRRRESRAVHETHETRRQPCVRMSALGSHEVGLYDAALSPPRGLSAPGAPASEPPPYNGNQR